MSGSRQRGFSAVELMITIAIAAILLSFAVPNFQDALARTRVAGAADELQAALALARAEALKLKLPVTLCARESDASCSGTTDWTTGFVLFRDVNGNGVRESTEEVLRTREFNLTEYVVRSETGSISLLGNGRIAGGGARVIEVLAPGCTVGTGAGPDVGKRRQLTVAVSGRASGRRLGCG